MAKTKKTFIVVLFAALITVAMIGTPLSIYAADECDATISPEGLIHIPVLRYIDDLYTVDLQYHGTSGSSIDLSVENVQPTTQECPIESELTSLSPFTLEIVSLAIGSDNYDITLSDDPGLQINAPRSPSIFDKGYDDRVVGPKTIFRISLEIIKQSLNSDVWKGKSECTRDSNAVYPGGTAYATSKGRNVTFTRDNTVSLSETGQMIYKVSKGNLNYRAYVDYSGMQNLETAFTSAMASATGTIKKGLQSIGATGTAALNFERTGSAIFGTDTCNYSGTAYAEWLYIPEAIFRASSTSMIEVMRTGRVIEMNKLPGGCDNATCSANLRAWHCLVAHGHQSLDISVPDFAWVNGDLTCTWSFKYYP